MTGNIRSAYFLNYGSAFESISSASLSIDASPTVNPDINPPNKVKPRAILAYSIIYVVVKSSEAALFKVCFKVLQFETSSF